MYTNISKYEYFTHIHKKTSPFTYNSTLVTSETLYSIGQGLTPQIWVENESTETGNT